LSWHHGQDFAPGATAASDIMSDYYGFDPVYGWHRYQEAVVTVGTDLVHYINREDGLGWQQAETIVSGVSGQGSIIQSDWYSVSPRDGQVHAHFEVVVQKNNHIEHWWNDGGSVWNHDADFAINVAAGPASIIQSDWYSFNPGDQNWHGHFEVLVPQNGGDLVHYVNRNDGSPWYQAETITNNVIWPASIIQSDWYSWNPSDLNWHGHFEVLLSFGNDLWHYVNYNDGQPWYAAERLASCIFGPSNGNQHESGSGWSGMSVGKAPWYSLGAPNSPSGEYGHGDAASSARPHESQLAIREEVHQATLPTSRSESQGFADGSLTPALAGDIVRGKDSLFGDPTLRLLENGL
jgi:hypothetical protein